MMKDNANKRGLPKAAFMILVILAMLVFTACSGDGSAETKNAHLEETLGQELLDGVKFKDTLEPVESNAVETMYGITQEQSPACKVYMSTGATAEEIAVFFVETKEAGEEVLEAVQARIQDQKTIMEGYLPAEMDKLNNAIIKQNDNYVVLCITADEEDAQKILGKYF